MKTIHTIYGILYLILCMCSLVWLKASAQMFFGDPDLNGFALVVVNAYAFFKSICGISQNSIKIMKINSIGETQKNEGDI